MSNLILPSRDLVKPGMSRRGFLAALGVTAVSVAVPKLWTPTTDELPIVITAYYDARSQGYCLVRGEGPPDALYRSRWILPPGTRVLGVSCQQLGKTLTIHAEDAGRLSLIGRRISSFV